MKTRREEADELLDIVEKSMSKYQIRTYSDYLNMIHADTALLTRLRNNPDEMKNTTFDKYKRKINDFFSGKTIRQTRFVPGNKSLVQSTLKFKWDYASMEDPEIFDHIAEALNVLSTRSAKFRKLIMHI